MSYVLLMLMEKKKTSNHFEIINISGGIKVYNDRNFIDEILQKEEKK